MKKVKNFKLNIKPVSKAKWQKQVISFVTAFVLLFTSMPVADMSNLASSLITKFTNLVSMADEVYTDSIISKINNNTYTVNTKDDLIKLYNSDPSEYENITIHFAMTTPFERDDFADFTRGLGNVEHPFKGKLTLNQGTDLILNLDHALFDYIDDSAELCEIKFIRKDDGQKYPLLAEHVVHTTGSTTPKKWKIAKNLGSITSTSSSTNYPFSAVIGKMENNSIVDLTFNNTVDNNMKGSVNGENAGLACGEMGENSKLTFSFESVNYDVTADENAGSLVGKMDKNAILTIGKTFTYSGSIDGKNAGGLVGTLSDANIVMASDVATPILKCTVSGTGNIGGLFGHCIVTDTTYFNEYDLSQWSDSAVILSGADTTIMGGFFGLFENNNTQANVITFSSNDVALNVLNNVNNKNADIVGGIIGKYSASSQTSTLKISNVNLSESIRGNINCYGLVIGQLGDSPAYVSLSNITTETVSNSTLTPNNYFGGMIGYAPNAFIDISGTNKLSANKSQNGYGAGSGAGSLVGAMGTAGGVLRLSGTTDLTGIMRQYKGTSDGVLVGKRNNGFIFAAENWKLTRNASSSYSDRYNDDIGDWGEVLRLDGTNLKVGSDGIFSVDETNHTVTINGLDSNTVEINTLANFVKAALTIQNYFGGEILKLSQGSVSGSELLKGTFNFNADVDLTGTGVLGLMRDTNLDIDNYTYEDFTGTINGNSHSLKLAIGEKYGTNVNSSETTIVNNGKMARRAYCGLLSTTNGATIKDLTINGTIDTFADQNPSYIGCVTAYNKGELTIENVKTDVTINVGDTNSSYVDNIFVGGVVGYSENGNLSFTNCNSNVSITNYLAIRTDKGASNNDYFSSMVGYVKGTGAITFDKVTVGGKIEYCKRTYNANVGGLVAEIYADVNSAQRTITVKETVVDGLTIKSDSGFKRADKYNGNCGGFLGHGWYNTNVTFESLIVKNSNMEVSGDGVFFAGLVYASSGYWNVENIKFEDTNSITGTGTSDRFGMLVNKACKVNDTTDAPIDGNDYDSKNSNTALYLEITGDYKISKDTTINLNSYAVFDEIAAFSTNDHGEGSNGQGVISIPAKDSNGDRTLIMDGENCNTYQNQTSNNGTAWTGNPNTRYYYNLDTIRAKADIEKSAGEKLLIWSVYYYAQQNLKSYFSISFGFDGNAAYDMKDLSYYPVDAGDVMIGGTFKFYNKEIETSETSTTGNSDNYSRTTTGSDSDHTQHYRMHHGIFRNVSGKTQISVNMTLTGSIGKTNNGSGALVCGQVNPGTSSKKNTLFVGNDWGSTPSIILKDLYVYNSDNSNFDYAPLLVNRLDSFVSLDLKSVSTQKSGTTYNMGDQDYAATSLIGYVGGTNKSDIDLTFSGIKLDARKTADKNSDLDTAYNTTKSIFKNATLLERFTYSSSGKGVYNYTSTDDWSNGRNVTYGYEVNHSVENNGLQEKYYKEKVYTSPVENGATSVYDFKDYLPYVHITKATASSASDNDHELSVNVSPTDLDIGCGTYNDPYIVTAKELELVATIIGTQKFDDGFSINYKEYNSYCDKSSHVKYTYTNGKFVSSDGKTITEADIIKHLCSAYYEIDEDITLSTSFVGLGGSSNDYGFRGVITGKITDGKTVTITNESDNPLIRNSNGSVVKNLKIINNETDSVRSCWDNALKFDYTSDSCQYYGGVIGQIFGGDNIIDNVSVENKNVYVWGDYDYLVPVGSYVGVIVSGGLYFRNMDTTTHSITAYYKGEKIEPTSDKYKNYFYYNQCIGRVINGFAVEEGTAFKKSSNLDNGSKNYTIMQVNANTDEDKKLYPKKDSSGNIMYIPDAQALFILGAITKDGSCQAIDSSTYGINMMVHNAQYSKIGNCTSSDDDFKNAQTDYQYEYKYVAKQNPKYTHLIKTYTRANAAGTGYEAKWLNNNQYKLYLNGDDYDLTDVEFKGINQLYGNNYSMPKILGFDGNNKTIKLNINVNTYASDNYRVFDGIGLFNRLSFNDATGSIDDLCLSGTVNFTSFTSATDTNSVIDANVSSGALIGKSQSTATVNNIQLKDVNVLGYSNISGGLIGSTGYQLTINGVSSTSVTVQGNACVGGVVGKFTGSKLDIKGSENSKSDFIVDTIHTYNNLLSIDSYDNLANNIGAGGIVGFLGGKSDNSISNITLKSKNNSSSYIGNPWFTSDVAGGLVGTVGNTMNISNCKVAIKVAGSIAGGIVGYANNTVNLTKTYFGSDSTQYDVKGAYTSGGLGGYTKTAINVDECGVENANIYNMENNGNYTSSKINDYFDVGGLYGRCSDGSNVSADNVIKNTYVKNCNITANRVIDKTSIGGLIGNTGSSSKNNIGYNILLKNVTMTGTGVSENNKGNLIGVAGSSSKYKFVGVTKQGSGFTSKDFGNSTSAYCVKSDHNGVCETETANKNGVYPYVNVNPTIKIGNIDLFGDSVILDNKNEPSSQSIINDTANSDNTSNIKYQSKNIKSYADNFNEKYSSKLTVYSDVEKLPNGVSNFPVLVIDDNLSSSITDMLTDYISVITDNDMAGTKGNSNWKSFTATDVADVTIKTYSYDTSSAEYSDTSDPSLSYDADSQLFSIIHGKYDNDSDTSKITVITLKYYDPADKTNTVMQLDIPVFVKKVLDFSFDSRVLSGTDYNASDYDNANLTAYESFGQPITTYFSYSYYRSADEWADSLNSGEDLLSNFSKNLYLFGDSSASGVLPEGTKFTLVDKNNSDKSYSTELGSTNFDSTNGKLDLSKIENFTPLTLNDLLMKYADVTAEKSDSGTLVETTMKDATACAMVNGEKKYFKYSDEDGVEKYTISVQQKDTSAEQLIVKESYYLTIITPSTNENKVLKNYIRYYTSENKHLEGLIATNDIGTGQTSTYIIGNFFEQKVSVTANNSEMIDSLNNYVSATLTANIKLNSELASTFKGYNDANGRIYQAFQMRLQKFENNSQTGSNTSIIGGTSIRTDISLKSGNNTIQQPTQNEVLSSSADYYTIKYPESIWNDLKNSDDGLTIQANVTLTYDENLLRSQFPEKKSDTDSRTGIAVITSSNISYTESNIENSSITLLSDATDKHYYLRKVTSAKLYYNVSTEGINDPNAQLGVNPYDTDVESELISADATYDISDLENKENASKIKYTLSLYKKNDSGEYEPVSINDYLTDVTVYDENSTVLGENYTYEVDYNESKNKYDISTKFKVKTGSGFESKNYYYANYKVVLNAELIDSSEQKINNSSATDYIIYTNAKINSSFVK